VSALFLLLVIILSKIPFKVIFKSLKPLTFIIIFTFIMNILFVNSGKILFEIGFLKISTGGIIYSLRILFRLIILIFASAMLTFTTSTLEFADGIESLLNPLKKIKFPSHEISMMITIALRFIPTIIEELDKIKKAQMSRGVDFETGSILKRAKAFIPILIPLFVSSFKRADELAMAMEARCYRGDINRTKMKIFKLNNIDYIAIFISLIYFALIIILRFTVEK
ncbi:MAG: energy-coupling factor transporter transmembrane protein EcfT, partial [Eubacteriales bacterium]|nr:energy-coupling factor transporter transmembrane protein EcfT [Eubacteriales bacterium]